LEHIIRAKKIKTYSLLISSRDYTKHESIGQVDYSDLDELKFFSPKAAIHIYGGFASYEYVSGWKSFEDLYGDMLA
jgi:hypothetical protein